MSELISGKEALIALANGEEVQASVNGFDWKEAVEFGLVYFLNGDAYFRLKPITVSVNGRSVTKPYLASRDGKKIEIEFYSETNAHDFMEALRNAT